MLNKILGGLFGQALGDAWAMPALMTPEDTWQRFNGFIDRFLNPPADHFVHSGLKAGQVTDDTEQAFAIAEIMIEERKVTAEGVARAILHWYERIGGDSSPYVGPSTRRAVLAIKRGEDIYTTGKHGDTNGASMRVSPIGLIHPGDIPAAVNDAYLSCIPTHHTDIAISGAAAIAAGVAAAMPQNADLDIIVNAGVQAADMGRKLGNRWYGASISRRIQMAVEIAKSGLSERQKIHEMYDVIGSGLAISEAVPAAFGVLVMGKGDPRQTAIYAAALSGDADTVGAMACAMAGAWKGIEAFSSEITDTLRKVNPAMDFDGVAQGLLSLIH